MYIFVRLFIYLTVLDPLCRDCVSSCDTWAKRGLCTSKPVFMFGFCRLTCGLCYNSSSKSRCFGRVLNGVRGHLSQYLHHGLICFNYHKTRDNLNLFTSAGIASLSTNVAFTDLHNRL